MLISIFCIAGITCGYPADISHGQYQLVNGTVTYLSQVVYSCNEGYDMVGRARLTCDIDERWNGPPPRCEPILCHDPPIISNGRYTQTNNITIAGTVIEYFCDSRKYKLIGPKKIVCLPIGQYDKPPPVCKEETGRPLGGLLGIMNKPSTTRPSTSRPRPSIIQSTRPPYSPARPGPQSPTVIEEDYEEVIRRPSRPQSYPIDHDNKSERPTFVTPAVHGLHPRPTDTRHSGTSNIPHVTAGHPQENEIPDSVNIRNDLQPNANIPSSVEEDRRETAGARLNLGKKPKFFNGGLGTNNEAICHKFCEARSHLGHVKMQGGNLWHIKALRLEKH